MSGKGGSGGADEHCQCFFGMVVSMVINSRLRPLIPNWCAVQQHPLTSIDHQFAKKKLTFSQSHYDGYTLYHGTMVVITGECRWHSARIHSREKLWTQETKQNRNDSSLRQNMTHFCSGFEISELEQCYQEIFSAMYL